MPQSSNRFRVLLAMLTMYVVWGTTYLAIKVGLDARLPPTLFCGVRQLPAAAILFTLAASQGRPLRAPLRDLRVSAIVGLLLIGGGQYLTFVAEQRTASGLSALVVALLPLWIALAEWVMPDMRRLSRRGWLGLLIGFAGLAILLAPKLLGASAGPGELLGIAVQVGGTWLWAAGSIYSKRHKVGIDGVVMTAYEMLVAGVVLIGLGSLLGEWPRFTLTVKGASAIAYLAVMGSAVAFTAFGYALAHLPASKVMTYAFVNPVIAVFAGALAGRIGLVPAEPLTIAEFVGMAVIVGGVALTTAAPTLPARNAPAEEPLLEPRPSEI